MIGPTDSLADISFAVCTALDRVGVVAVLTGGSAANYYVPTVYQSLDADFILRYDARRDEVDSAMQALGFQRRPSGDFAHADTPYTIDFPRGPLAIGSDLVTTWATVRRGSQLLRVLDPTDVVRDRFLHYFAWADLTGYDSALAIARAMNETVDWSKFTEWAERESRLDRSYDPKRLDRFLRDLGIRAR